LSPLLVDCAVADGGVAGVEGVVDGAVGVADDGGCVAGLCAADGFVAGAFGEVDGDCASTTAETPRMVAANIADRNRFISLTSRACRVCNCVPTRRAGSTLR
jgi:hypothetical protein